MTRKPHDSEFQSYTYIKNDLLGKGWNVRNPIRDVNGQLYTQHECHQHPELKKLLNKGTPEYIVKLRADAFWVIEAKPTIDRLDVAYDEAVAYAEKINKHEFIRAKIVSGVAGNDIDQYVVKNGFWNEEKNKFEIIEYHGKDIESLLSLEIVKTLLQQDSAVLKEFNVEDEILLSAAEKINEILHASSIR